jgi:hypothetical protein
MNMKHEKRSKTHTHTTELYTIHNTLHQITKDSEGSMIMKVSSKMRLTYQERHYESHEETQIESHQLFYRHCLCIYIYIITLKLS